MRHRAGQSSLDRLPRHSRRTSNLTFGNMRQLPASDLTPVLEAVRIKAVYRPVKG